MKHSPLDAVHRALGAKMVDFGGWEMPLSYPDGTIAEHQACRDSAAVFDVSHLGTLAVSGPASFELLQHAFTNDLSRIEIGRAQYTHLLDPETASVVDDIIVWWMGEDAFDVIPNASNTPAVTAALRALSSDLDVSISDTTSTRAVLAVQGPNSRRVLATVSDAAAGVGRFRVVPFEFQGAECTAAGTGYTGEDGAECAVPVDVAEDFWNAIVAAGARPAGLGARDTLRLEAGFPLHGHELGNGLTPLQASLEWVIGWNKGDFVGREVLAAQKAQGLDSVVRGLSTEGRRPPRQGQSVRLEGTEIGTVSSGNFSPTLGHGIAMALLDPGVEIGSTVEIDVRGTAMPAQIVELPFYKVPKIKS